MALVEKLKNDIENCEKLIEKVTYQVGIQCVKAHSEESGTEYEELFAQIRALRGQIAEDKEKIRQETEKKNCPSCGFANKMSSKFCVNCGSPLNGEAAKPAEPEKKKCRKCGMVNDDDALFCINCGNKLEDPAKEEVSEKLVEDIEEALEETAEEITENEIQEEQPAGKES